MIAEGASKRMTNDLCLLICLVCLFVCFLSCFAIICVEPSRTLLEMTVVEVSPLGAPPSGGGLVSSLKSTTQKATLQAPSSKQYLILSGEQKAELKFQVVQHTQSHPASESTLETFVELINTSFTGSYHDENFGSKPRYTSIDALVSDLSHGDGDGGAWLFMLWALTAHGDRAVAGAKITLSGQGMDGGPSLHTTYNASYTPASASSTLSSLPTFWLGALGTISPGTGPILISHIKSFLVAQPMSKDGYVMRAYTVAEWGVNKGYVVPQESPLVSFFQRQAFNVIEWSWKPPGTWASFHGGCLAAIEYVHRP